MKEKAHAPGKARAPAAWCAGLIVAATVAAYSASFAGPFVFDDTTTIRDNPTIRQPWPFWQALFPPAGQGLTSNGRPLVNWSLALNYAISGNAVWSYHALNLTIHLLAALTLFGIVRRTLVGQAGLSRRGEAKTDDLAIKPGTQQPGHRPGLQFPTLLALAIALIWTLHPLQTEAVTYIVQRAESMMGLFYLLTLYCFIRHAGGGRRPPGGGGSAGDVALRRPEVGGHLIWAALSVLACVLGMATKEVMVSAPLIVLLYDRTFVAGNFAEAWRRRWGYYLALVPPWIFLGYEVIVTGNRGATAGFGTAVPWGPYALTQLTAIVRYLRLAFWPRHLVFDYGTGLITGAPQVAPCALAVAALAAATVYALWRRDLAGRAFGFAGAWFFAILAPSSSVVPVATQVMAEHRMYLPLAAVVAVVLVAGCEWAAARFSAARSFLLLMLGLAGLLGMLTARRNRDYRSELALWSSSADHFPGNPRNHSNLGYAINALGDPRRAITEFQEALKLDPDYADAQNNLGGAYFQLGNLPESIAHYRQALRDNPAMAGAHYNLGNSLVRLGQVDAGMAEFHESLRLDPGSPEAHYNYATSLADQHRLAEAIPEFGEALRIRPDYTEARNNLATALLQTGHLDEALSQYRQVLAVNPASATTHFNLANLLVQKGNLADAVSHYRRALAIEPNYAKAHCNLGSVFVRLRQLPEAVAEYREALRLNPGMAEARDNLARVEAYLQANPP